MFKVRSLLVIPSLFLLFVIILQHADPGKGTIAYIMCSLPVVTLILSYFCQRYTRHFLMVTCYMMQTFLLTMMAVYSNVNQGKNLDPASKVTGQLKVNYMFIFNMLMIAAIN